MARYIDADDLIADRVENDPVRIAALCAETADVAEVKRGEWERMINPYGELEGFMCECGHQSQAATNYCPNCGALNKGEGAE